MATHAVLKELHESDCIFSAIIGNFMHPAFSAQPMICVQKNHSIDLYSVNPLSPSKFVFILSYPICGKIREIVKIPFTGIDGILVWVDECKVLLR